MAVLGLAAVISFGSAGVAGAAPADRADDPVVLKGSQVAGLEGIAPNRIVAFKWNGAWEQVPVQVDERHVVSVRNLYPADPPGYVNDDVSFDLEVYADPKTRSGADEDPNLDANDEISFMGGDTGGVAPGNAVAPKGVVASSGTRIDVGDPLDTGSAQLYLFSSDGTLDPSAGKDYVDYDFKLTNFGANDTLIDNYGFSDPNPEDSSVTTPNYQLHFIDRWMEDEMKIKTGGASDADILDREGVSAGGLGGCTRSEYTFSGNWGMDATTGNDENTDDEGTMIAVKDGSVRAIRSYMGANSGPYVEDDHIFYADREDRRVYARVHPIPEMYVWTDYNESAIGMTYRDEMNQDGVEIDGVPDTLDPVPPAAIENGKYLWQQVAGSHGTVTTMVSATTGGLTPQDRENFQFAGYYLDNSSPSSDSHDKERQCGGDLKAYGASGFGIDGTYPSTDPILATPTSPARSLSVDRIRYFGAPNGTAAEAGALRDRAQNPLGASSVAAGVKARSAAVKVKVQTKKSKSKPGKKLKLKVKVSNPGTADAKKLKVCVTGKAIRKSCKTVASLASGKSKIVTLKPKVKRKAKKGKSKLTVKVTGGGVKAVRGTSRLTIKR